MSEYVDVRTPETDKLLFKFDPHRDIIWIRIRGQDHLIDLQQVRERAQQAEEGEDRAA